MEELYELNLRDYGMIFLKRKWEILISFFVVFLSIFIYTEVQVPLFRATVLLRVEVQQTFPSDVVLGRSYRVGDDPADVSSQLVSRTILGEVLKELGWIDEITSDSKKEHLISEVSSWVSAARVESSNLVRFTVQCEDPKKAMLIANRVTELFKKVNARNKNAYNRNVRVFIEQRLEVVSQQLKVQDERMRVLTTKGIIGTGVTVKKRISDLEDKLNELQNKFTAQHPAIITLKGDLERLRKELQELPEEEFEYAVLKRDMTINETLYSLLKTNLQQAQIREAEYVDNISILNPAVLPTSPFFPNKSKNLTIAIFLGIVLGISTALVIEHMDTSIGRVDDIESFIKVGVVGIIPYLPKPNPESNKKNRRTSRRIVRSKEKFAINPFEIMDAEKTENISLFLESFRLLGVNLQVIFGKEGNKIKNKLIMITSSKPEEGKTVIVATLGITLSQMGYKVLVVDSDVRRAHIHKTFGILKKEDGLTDLLIGKLNEAQAIKTSAEVLSGPADVNKIIERPWLNNLHIMTAGSTIANTIHLFNSKRLDELLVYAKNNYDIVLFDTSPILAVSEPSMLLTKMDGVLLVYRAGATSRLALRRSKVQIESIRGKGSIAGVILNNVTPEIGMDTYYYYNRKYYAREEKPRSP